MVTVVRDLVCLGVGSFGIIYQQLTMVNVPLLALYTALVGTPAAAGVFRILRSVPLDPGPSQPQPPSSPGAAP